MASDWAAAGGLGLGGQTGTLSRCLGQSLSNSCVTLAKTLPCSGPQLFLQDTEMG